MKAIPSLNATATQLPIRSLPNVSPLAPGFRCNVRAGILRSAAMSAAAMPCSVQRGATRFHTRSRRTPSRHTSTAAPVASTCTRRTRASTAKHLLTRHASNTAPAQLVVFAVAAPVPRSSSRFRTSPIVYRPFASAWLKERAWVAQCP